MSRLGPGLIEVLTPTEERVFACVASGMSNQQAARQLGLRVRTVSTHLHNIYSKLGVHSRTEAVVKLGKVKADPAQVATLLGQIGVVEQELSRLRSLLEGRQ